MHLWELSSAYIYFSLWKSGNCVYLEHQEGMFENNFVGCISWQLTKRRNALNTQFPDPQKTRLNVERNPNDGYIVRDIEGVIADCSREKKNVEWANEKWFGKLLRFFIVVNMMKLLAQKSVKISLLTLDCPCHKLRELCNFHTSIFFPRSLHKFAAIKRLIFK